ncbi:MAG: DUF3568 family protein [Candidatus Omnitrophota bacterium]
MKRLFKIIFYFSLACMVFVNISGCAPLLVGMAAGGVGIYAISGDTIQGDTDKSYDSLWDAALSISSIRGTVKQEEALRGYIELDSGNSKVWIRVIKLTQSSNRLKVSARRFHFPNLSLAQDFFVKIIEGAGP